MLFSTLQAEEKPEQKDFRFWEHKDSNWYIGASGFIEDAVTGRSSNAIEYEVADVLSVLTTKYKSTAVGSGYQVYVGYNVNPIIGVEMKFSQVVGPYKFFIERDYVADPLGFSDKRNFDLKQIAFGPATLVSIPISDYFTPYFKGGFFVFYYDRTFKYTPENSPPTLSPLKARYWDIRFIQGFGIKAKIINHLGIRLEYECASNPIIDNQVKLIQGDLNLSLFTSF